MDSLECENREELASKLAYNRRLSKTMIFTILGLFVAMAIAVGVGVGLTKKESSISKAQQALPYHGNIFEGSSLAVIAPPNGDRRLFFQNRNGAIIQALFQASVNKWNTQVVVAGNARNHTPISAFTFRDKSVSCTTILGKKKLAEWFRSCSLSIFTMGVARWFWPNFR